jgi:phosphoribosylformylglycinamidine (FGAM) synthase-like enzyme/phosphoribosylformylglycinamidine (FGAM) synthase-like amidotransferase family enzyme
MILVRGKPALSAARRARAFAKAKGACDGLAMLETCWVHLVVSNRELTAAERTQLEHMLTYGPHVEPMAAPGSMISAAAGNVGREVFWVTPRVGTTSPWSSKATDIAQVCGLASVTRIERTLEYTVHGAKLDVAAIGRALSDRMTESVITAEVDLAKVVAAPGTPRPLGTIALGRDGIATLREASTRLGLALAPDEIEYLVNRYRELGRDPTDVELMMFAQANSEHCRHKIFNAEFWIDGVRQEHSLFQLIKESTANAPGGVLSAYKDNAAVVAGNIAERLFPEGSGVYRAVAEPQHILGKVETHNHPTAISPFPGAATGSGGEIRDEGATGRGAKPKAGLVGFTVSDLRIPNALEPWEPPPASWIGSPSRIATAVDIMTEGPLGGAAFNNEFGRPAILGYFRTYEHDDRGYHKPVMLAGGIGAVRPGHVKKAPVPAGAALIVLGGPAFLIGLGGGAASSVAQGSSTEDLDFASVQRDNPEIQRRCQEVIDRCWALGDDNLILSIHDVGAGGLSNAMPELVHDAGLGARLELRAIPTGEADLSPLELWSNEAQERYVLAIDPARVAEFAALCARERAPWAQLGTATPEGNLVVSDQLHGKPAVDIPLDLMLGKAPKMIRRAETVAPERAALQLGNATVAQALDRVLGLPTVADKSFLVTIGDRTVGGMVSRDPMVGRFQVPVADHALTLSGFDTTAGEVMSLGERPPVALLDAGAASRLAIGEAITNLASAPIGPLGRIKLSCNWMAAAGHPGEDARLYAGVRAASECAVALGIAIPVGKDSMSMRTQWGGGGVVQHSDPARAIPAQSIKTIKSEPLPTVVTSATVAETMAELERELAVEARTQSKDPVDPEAAELEELARIAGKRWRDAQSSSPDLDPEDLVTTGRFSRPSTKPHTDDLATERSDRFRGEGKILGPALPEDELSTRRRKRAASGVPDASEDEVTSPWAERDQLPTHPGDLSDEIILPPDELTTTKEWPNPLAKTGEWKGRRDATIASASEAAIGAAVAAVDSLSERVSGGPAGYIARGAKAATTRERVKQIVSPVTLVVTAFGPVSDVRLAITPELQGNGHELLLVDLGAGKNRLGGSCLAQVYDQLGDTPPDLDDPKRLLAFYDAIQMLLATRKLTAYHDRADGGLAATVLEMAFSSGLGLDLEVTAVGRDPFAALFCEELGAVVEVATPDVGYVRGLLAASGAQVHAIGRAVAGERIRVVHDGKPVIDATRKDLRARWSHVTHQMAKRRDDPTCADEEHASRIAESGLSAQLTFDLANMKPPGVLTSRPRVAILREQGVNGQIEMAAAFTRAGFDAVDIHMTDLIEGRADLTDMRGAVACGGFSFGDVLGAGRGWASTFRYNARARDALAKFTSRTDTFLLGVCNGCQALADLADQLPGAATWPRFVRNRSEQFEARLVLLEIEDSPSVFFRGMAGSRIPVANSHGEGRAELSPDQLAALERAGLVAARFVDGTGAVATTYPANPNGSPGGVAALTTADGRLTVMMPHPERVFRTAQLSWHPAGWDEDSPWMNMFYNARAWVS